MSIVMMFLCGLLSLVFITRSDLKKRETRSKYYRNYKPTRACEEYLSIWLAYIYYACFDRTDENPYVRACRGVDAKFDHENYLSMFQTDLKQIDWVCPTPDDFDKFGYHCTLATPGYNGFKRILYEDESKNRRFMESNEFSDYAEKMWERFNQLIDMFCEYERRTHLPDHDDLSRYYDRDRFGIPYDNRKRIWGSDGSQEEQKDVPVSIFDIHDWVPDDVDYDKLKELYQSARGQIEKIAKLLNRSL